MGRPSSPSRHAPRATRHHPATARERSGTSAAAAAAAGLGETSRMHTPERSAPKKWSGASIIHTTTTTFT